MNNTTCEMAIEFYYRTTIFVPYVDHFISQLEARFLAHKNIYSKVCIFYILVIII